MQNIRDLKLALKSLTSQAIVRMKFNYVQGLDKLCTKLLGMSNLNNFNNLNAHVLNVQAFKTTKVYFIKNIYKYMIIQGKRNNTKYTVGIEEVGTESHLSNFDRLAYLPLVHVLEGFEKVNNIKRLVIRLCPRFVGTGKYNIEGAVK